MARAYLVETIPQGLERLRRPDMRETADVLLALVSGAHSTIDLTAVYWNLLHHPEAEDERGFNAEAVEQLGAGRGRRLYEALLAAAGRGVEIRILQSPGFLPATTESDALARAFPERVRVRQVEMAAWYGGGILHQKLWLVDGRHLYLGSANMDWRSLAQVKEVGVVVEDDPALVADLTRQYEAWWRFAALAPRLETVADPISGQRPVPCWSPLLPVGRRCPNPLDRPELLPSHDLGNPLPVQWNGQQATAFTSSSPAALCPPGRTPDLDAVRHTIAEAEERVDISVMHFVPMSNAHVTVGMEKVGAETVVFYWPALVDALLQAVCRGVRVRLLASRWVYTPPAMVAQLQAVQQLAAACPRQGCRPGGVEVRLFTIPGWEETVGEDRRYPGHSRVNHAKYVVSERRLNVGTSNMGWNDFAQNGGTSLNTTHPHLVDQAQAIFERDWHSRYALSLS